MSLLGILNRSLDIGCKVILLLAALALALLPIPFLLGHEALHTQPYYSALDQHQGRTSELQQLATQRVGNLFLKEGESVDVSAMEETMQLGDFACYWLQQQGEAVVRKNLQVKQKKRVKKGMDLQVFPVKSVSTLLEEPPLQDLKDQISEYVGFQGSALSSKIWVIVSSNQLDNSIANEIETISQQNPGYRFMVVSPNPLKHDIFGGNRTSEGQKATSEKREQPEVDADPTEEKNSQPEVEKQQKQSKKGKKTKVKKVKIEAEAVKEEL